MNRAVLVATPIRGESGNLSDRVAIEISGQIISGRLAPGDRLPTESEIGEAFVVSRSVVRDALRTLEALGLVAIRQGRGITVTKPSDSPLGEAVIVFLMRSGLSMGDVIAARGAIETELAPLAAIRGTDEDWAMLERHLADFSTAVEAGAWGEVAESHHRFHLGIMAALHLPALEILLRPMQQVIMLTSLPPRLEDESLWEVWAHYPILESLKARDAAGVKAAMEQHFRNLESDQYTRFRAAPFRDCAAAQRLFRDVIKRSRPQSARSPSAKARRGET